MDKDIIVAEDEDVKIIFHFKVFCELLKECMSIYGNTTIAYIIHSGFISGYQNRYGDNLKPPTNVYHRMTA